MVLLKRLVLVACVVLCGSIALAVAAVAAGGPPTSSSSSFKDVGASASTFVAKGGPGFDLFVSRSDSSFSTGKGTEVTQVSLSIVTAAGASSFGCLVIPDSDFKVKADLQSASLSTRLTGANLQCPGKGGIPPGPNPNPLQLPITINLTWAGNGVVSTSRDSHSFDCLSYSTELNSTTRTASGSASGTMSGLPPGTFSVPLASVSSDHSDQESQGTPPNSCFGF